MKSNLSLEITIIVNEDACVDIFICIIHLAERRINKLVPLEFKQVVGTAGYDEGIGADYSQVNIFCACRGYRVCP